MSSPIAQAIKQISEEKGIAVESVIETIEAALAAAYRKDFGELNQNHKVTFDMESGDFEVFDVKTVVEDQELPPELTEEQRAELAANPPPPAEPVIGEDGLPVEEKKFNPKTEVMISEAKKTLDKKAEIGQEIRTKLEVPAAFGRMAAQTAREVIIQKIREAERNKLFGEFKEREHELINATVQRKEGKMVLIDLGRATAVLPPEEQIPTERYNPGDRVKVFVTDVRMSTRGPEVVVSRAHPEIVKKLFGLEIPEVLAGTVVIHHIAREAGSRSKVAVSSTQENIDPVGSCIGQRGTRIQTIIGELGGEKIDIIPFDADPARYIANALSPAKISEVDLDEAAHVANVTVPDDQLSLAIGKGGQNVRLASRLTGWRINIREANKPAAESPVAPTEEVPSAADDDAKEPEEATPEKAAEENEGAPTAL